MDHYERLGIDRDADEQTIKVNFTISVMRISFLVQDQAGMNSHMV